MDSFWLIIILLVGGIILVAVANAQAIEKAKSAYQQSLADLTRNPANPAIHQKTLALGRVYSNLTRNKQGVTLFDEVALMNDINAACGGSRAALNNSSPSALPRVDNSSSEERLKRLMELKNQGLISDNEYQNKRQQIINEM